MAQGHWNWKLKLNQTNDHSINWLPFTKSKDSDKRHLQSGYLFAHWYFSQEYEKKLFKKLFFASLLLATNKPIILSRFFLIYLPLESFAHSVYRICLRYKRAEQKNDQLTAFLSLPLSTVINDPIKVMWFSFEFGLLRTKGNMQINRASRNYYSHK